MQAKINPEFPLPWWKARIVEVNHKLDCAIGPLCLQVFRSSDEWQLGWYYEDEMYTGSRCSIKITPGPVQTEQTERYTYAKQDHTLRLRPALMDRSVVIRPREPVFLPSGEEVTLFLSTPLCLVIEVGEVPVKLRELPMMQLSDTWFGPSTREGELCYSGRTHARNSLDEVPQRQHRALTPILIKNQANSVLPLEKLSLPARLLSLYGADDGNFWTQGVSLTRTEESELAMIRIGTGVPECAGEAELISPARMQAERGGFVRVFSLLFNG